MRIHRAFEEAGCLVINGGTGASRLQVEVMLSQFVLKVSWEVVLTPVTYAVVGWLKRREGVEVFDVGTNFTPFSARV